jgi:hypothetical protein
MVRVSERIARRDEVIIGSEWGFEKKWVEMK